MLNPAPTTETAQSCYCHYPSDSRSLCLMRGVCLRVVEEEADRQMVVDGLEYIAARRSGAAT